ncbi:hypothetical protein AS029_07400 [Microbacterium enclense]|nr:hypothetical protein AS029_07400 [Microbacterium enclense]
MSPRYLGVMALVAVSGLLLVGCTREETEHMTPEQARDQTMSVLYGTMRASGITGWIPDAEGQPLPQGCKVADEDGVTFGHGAYAQPENTDPAADAQRVVDYWDTLGIQSRVVTDPVIVVFGSGGPVNAISFATSPTYAISLGGICVPGDPFAYYDGLPTPPPPAP